MRKIINQPFPVLSGVDPTIRRRVIRLAASRIVYWKDPYIAGHWFVSGLVMLMLCSVLTTLSALNFVTWFGLFVLPWSVIVDMMLVPHYAEKIEPLLADALKDVAHFNVID
ncbi:hypothetical protein [Echinimonas agarilytica]|uniref:Uncharacterized protein n=1 Tax=Echinimonas agarilytica TaxID=1215918 RepID=A0AA41W3Y2_9GAMM|nr:hypothetical protein [Echinimonas agarilytica]MCM2678332.1 hypothetical protein [Echinimonas agarilytica]